MKKIIAGFAMTCALAAPVLAQTPTALEEAREANICSDIRDAEYTEDGRLRVTCAPFTVNPAYAASVMPAGTAGTAVPAVLAGTGLTAGAGAGILAAAVAIGIVAGGDDSVGTTTTTTTGN